MTTLFDQPAIRDESARHPHTHDSPLLKRVIPLNATVVTWAIILVVAIFTRFYMLGDRVMSHDESLHTRYSYNLYAEGNFQHTPLMHGPILFHMTALNYFLFGDSDFSARIYTAVLGVLMVMSPLLFQRWLGRKGAILAAILLLISPLVMYYNRYIREDTPAVLFSIIMVYCTMMYLDGPKNQKRKAHWLYIFSAALLANLGTKETAFIYVGVYGSFLGLYWIIRMIQHFWRVPSYSLMTLVSLGGLIGGVASLGMYIVLSIIRPETIQFGENTFILFTNWTGWIIGGSIGIIIGTAVWAFRGLDHKLPWLNILIILLVGAIAASGFIILEELSWIRESSAEQTAETLEPGDEAAAATEAFNPLPIAFLWVVGAAVVMFAIISWRAGWWRRTLHRFPELDIIIVMGTLILPWVTPLFIKLSGADPVDYSAQGIQLAIIALTPMLAMSAALGLVWNWKRWLICVAVFHVLFLFFFTTMFTNMLGIATGMIGSLGYWLNQQAVRRGSQPQYYYLLIIMPYYEFLPIVGSVAAMFAGLVAFWRRQRQRLEAKLAAEVFAAEGAQYATNGDEPSFAELIGEEGKRKRTEVPRDAWLTKFPFLLFVSWWAILNLIGYTLAGEKMPWLAIHMTLPMIFLSGWFFGRVFDAVDWGLFWKRGWLFIPLFILLIVAVFHVVSPFIINQSPFAGLEQQQLAALYQWLAMIAVTGLVLVFIYQVVERTNWRHVGHGIGIFAFLGLGFLTFRSAWMASFINYDYATEFIVYAHSAPAVKWVLDDLEDLSQRVTGGDGLRFAYDNETSWPNSWYFRDFPNAVFVGGNPTPQSLNDAIAVVVGEANRSKVEPILEDRYFAREYIRMWWPMQDYFNLNADRVANTFDFSPDNLQAAQIRQGLWDIWWARNYETYSEALGSNWTTTQWPVSDRMHLYVRKDIAAQIWNLGTGDVVVSNALVEEASEVNQCNANWQPLAAQIVFDTQSIPGAALTHPLDLSVGEDGQVYVAEEFAHEISIFSTTGQFVNSIGARDPSTEMTVFQRPNAVAVGPDGNLYIADTWNYRVQVYSPEGELLRGWGQPGQFGFEAAQSPEDGFWGPRDIAVDGFNRVFISDTGNKRVRVYTSEGQYIRDIGSGGSAEGQLDEPAGIAIHSDGRLFVADTWNRRVSVFSTDGEFLYAFPVRAWYDDLGNRPYIAIDEARDVVYVTDPDAGRILVYDTLGNCIGSFGQPTSEFPNETQFMTASGIAVDQDGSVYISDAGAGRIMRFAPFPLPEPPAEASESLETTVEVTSEEVDPSELEEQTAEVTADSTEDSGAETESN
jgi:predicted membrane-bound mannosyltransferase/DNA-binding beta-propeller fold protein YncE